MYVQALIKVKQNRLLSKTWRTVVTAREIERNFYTISEDMKKARAFALTAAMFKVNPRETINEPILIYSKEMVAL